MWSYSLEHSLQQIQPNLAPLITPETLGRLQAVSRYFPDALSHTVGFEYRLSSASSTVDFAILVNKPGAEILAGIHPTIRLDEQFEGHPLWQKIQTFCKACTNPSDQLSPRVSDIWLEFDLNSLVSAKPGGEDLPVPGLLFQPAVDSAMPDRAPDYAWVMNQALPLLWGEALPSGLKTKLFDCFASLPNSCRVLQVGARAVESVRLCVVGSLSQLMPYLLEIGWPGDIAEVEAIATGLSPYVDGILMSLDVGKQVHPRLGIEGFYRSRYLPCVNGQWQALLTYLVEQGLCKPQARAALMQYSGYSTANGIQPRYYVRSLNHLKLIYQTGKPLAANIHFGVMHQPTSLLAERMSTSQPTSAPGLTASVSKVVEESPAQAAESPSIAQAIRLATTFVLAARNPQGWWTDFQLAPGASDEWVTGYVGTMLNRVPDDRTIEAMRAAWNLLQSRRHRSTALWGYNLFPPGDADSTGWALQLATALGDTESDRVQQSRRSLLAHQQPDGGFSTYSDPASIRTFINAPPTLSFDGWCGAQVCVSAAIAALPDFRDSLLPYLNATQSVDGGWLAYWWHDPEYATALAAEAIALADPDSDRVTQAVTWGLQRLTLNGCVTTNDHPNGSPFATAWCVRLLGLRREDPTVKEAIAKSVQWLLSQQKADGSWVSSTRLRVPHPHDRHPEQAEHWVYHGRIQGSLVFDLQRVFTTATVLNVLSMLLPAGNTAKSPYSVPLE